MMHRLVWKSLFVGLVVLAACEPDRGLSSQPAPVSNGNTPTPLFDSGAPPTAPLPPFDAGAIVPPPVVVTAPPANGGADASAAGNAVPCDVAPILSQKCALCHGVKPKFNAPMPLMTAADFHVPGPVTKNQPVHAIAAARVNPPPSGQPMPPAGTVAALTAAERSTLTQWLMNGAPGSVSGCPVTEPPATGADAGVSAAPKSSGVSVTPYQGWDEGVECHKFLAHDGSKRGPHRVGIAVDSYTSFSLMPPWQGARYVRAFRAVVDNEQVLHHFLLFNEGGPVSDGAVSSGLPVHPSGELMQGWAPGGSDLYFTPDIGTEMLGSNGYTLEMHYNSSSASAVDASGVEVCVTAAKPANVITRAWVGTDNIAGSSASGVCAPSGNQRIHIVLGTPHMHLKGRHMKVVINRAGGKNEVVHDEDFDFENQRDYPEDIWLEPGDRISTTCSFNGIATFGQGTSQEMCYWFAMHYPAGALSDNSLLGGALHGANTCLGF